MAKKQMLDEFEKEEVGENKTSSVKLPEKLWQCKTPEEAAAYVAAKYGFKTYANCTDFLAELPAAGIAFSEMKINLKEARDNTKAIIETLALDFDEKFNDVRMRLEKIIVQLEEKDKTIAEKESEISRLNELVAKNQAEMERITKTR